MKTIKTNVPYAKPLYCVREKKKTENKNSKLLLTDNNRLQIRCICSSCGSAKSGFISAKDAKILAQNGGFLPLLIPALAALGKAIGLGAAGAAAGYGTKKALEAMGGKGVYIPGKIGGRGVYTPGKKYGTGLIVKKKTSR